MPYDVGSHMRPACFHSKGPTHYYVYEWQLNGETRYVGRGVGDRYTKFYTSRKYGSPERHGFVLENKAKLTCRFTVADVALDAAKEAEALLIGHWGLRKFGGILFNDQVPSLPSLSDLGENRRAAAQFNIPVNTPPSDKCLAIGEFYDTWLADKEEWADDALVSFTGQPSCWRAFHHGKPVKGWRLDHEVLRRCLPATVIEIVEFAKDFGFSARDVRAKRGHLSWGRDKGYLSITQTAYEP